MRRSPHPSLFNTRERLARALLTLTFIWSPARPGVADDTAANKRDFVPPASMPSGEPAEKPVIVGDTGLIDVHARDMEISNLLELISYEARAGIVTSPSVKGRISANLYQVSLTDALDAVLLPNGYAYRKQGRTLFVGTRDEIQAQQPPAATRLIRLKYISPGEAASAIRALLGNEAHITESTGVSTGGSTAGGAAAPPSPFGPVNAGGGGNVSDKMDPAGSDYLLVTDFPDRLDEAERLLAQLDVRPRQVLIEATVLRATLNEDNQLGIDFTVLGGVDFQNVSSTSNASADLATGDLPADKFQHTTVNTNTNFTRNVGDGGFTFGIIRDNVAFFIRALEEVTDVTVVANPKVVALNKQEGEVIVGRRDGYLTTTVTQTAAVQTVEFLETGTQIRFRPLISDDGAVRLAVRPKDSNGGLTAANLPFEETTEAHADVLIRDGDTLLIGGLFRERSVASRSQVPGLGSIPGLGLLLQSRHDQTIREEVIILMTVHILKDDEAEQTRFRMLLEDVERVRVGTRAGLLGIGRERLAQAYLHEALHRLDLGDRKGALLNVRMALHNQPRQLTAIKLKEQLLDERMWDDEGSRMRSFALDLLNQGRPARGYEDALTPFGRPVEIVHPEKVEPIASRPSMPEEAHGVTP